MCIFKIKNRNKLIKGSLKEILGAMNGLNSNFKKCRSLIPYIGENMIGERKIRTSPYYIKEGYNVEFTYPYSLKKEDIEENNKAATWINENFIVRLCALLEYYGILEYGRKIEKNFIGSECVDIIKKLRNIYAHSSGEINYGNTEHKKLLEKMRKCPNLSISEEKPKRFPTSIDTVIDPLFSGCREYVNEQLVKNNK